MSLWFTQISRNVAQPAKKAMTCQGMKTGAHVWHCDVGSMSSESFGLLGGCGWGLFLQHIWQMLDSTGIWTDHSRSNTVGFLSCAVTEYQDGWCVCGMHRYAITSTACSLLSTSPARSLMRLHMWKTEIPCLSGASMGVTTQTSLGLLWSLEVCCEETGNGCSSPSK